MSHRRTLAALALLVVSLVFPASVFANTNEPIAQTGGMEATIPLLGSSLSVAVALDDVGKISGVTVNPAGVVTEKEKTDTAVKFANADGTTKVSVKAKGAKMSISASSKSLADLVGKGAWSADVFGTGAKSTVDYAIGQSDGKPTVTINAGDIHPAAGITATATKAGSWKGKHDKRSWASAGVRFEAGGYAKHLRISVGVKGDGKAVLSIVLTGRDVLRLKGTLASLVGERTWKAHTCDGTPVSVTYRVTDTGAVQFVSATGGETKTKTLKKGLAVWFTGTKVGVWIATHKKGDEWKLAVVGSSGWCGAKKGAKPALAGWAWGSWDHKGGDRRDDKGGRGGGGGGWGGG